MFDSIRQRISHQINALKRRFAQTGGLPFSDVLPDETIRTIMDEEVGSYRDRIFSPLITLSAFLSQALSSDPSCRNAVAKVTTQVC